MPADPLQHCALNVSLHGPGGRRWAMTERGARALTRDACSLAIGPSRLHWGEDGALEIEVDEWCVPWPARLVGRIRLVPLARSGRWHALDDANAHAWAPIAPCARVEVAFERPACRWSGAGYLDTNRGSTALEHGFRRWHWSRAVLPDGRVLVLYDVEPRQGAPHTLALRADVQGGLEPVEPPPPRPLLRSAWRVARSTRADAGAPVEALRALEDGPFYVRSTLRTRALGAPVTALHESLDLDRFASRWVQALLPWRMPRRG